MKTNNLVKRMLSLLICLTLVAAAFMTISVAEEIKEEAQPTPNPEEVQGEIPNNAAEENVPIEIGEGKNTFLFEIWDLEGVQTVFSVHTDENVVGEALMKLELISGEEGPYGLYVKTVNGLYMDYAENGHYWAFYINGEYAMSGVDRTKIEPDTVYALKAE